MNRTILAALLLPSLPLVPSRAETSRPDRVPPRVVLAAPSAPPTLSFDVSVGALDIHGIAGVSLALNGRIVSERISPPWFFTINAEAFPVEVCARATDAAGNAARDCMVVGGPFACSIDGDCSDPLQYCWRGLLSCEGSGACQVRPDACPDNVAPVCGCDGKTYFNACEAAAAGVNVASTGPCPGQDCRSRSDCRHGEYCARDVGACGGRGLCTSRPSSCACPLDGPAPTEVCGCDGRTYACAAEATCKGKNLAYAGVCR